MPDGRYAVEDLDDASRARAHALPRTYRALLLPVSNGWHWSLYAVVRDEPVVVLHIDSIIKEDFPRTDPWPALERRASLGDVLDPRYLDEALPGSTYACVVVPNPQQAAGDNNCALHVMRNIHALYCHPDPNPLLTDPVLLNLTALLPDRDVGVGRRTVDALITHALDAMDRGTLSDWRAAVADEPYRDLLLRADAPARPPPPASGSRTGKERVQPPEDPPSLPMADDPLSPPMADDPPSPSPSSPMPEDPPSPMPEDPPSPSQMTAAMPLSAQVVYLPTRYNTRQSVTYLEDDDAVFEELRAQQLTESGARQKLDDESTEIDGLIIDAYAVCVKHWIPRDNMRILTTLAHRLSRCSSQTVSVRRSASSNRWSSTGW